MWNSKTCIKFLHVWYNSETFGLSYVGLYSTGRGCKDGIHVRDLVEETPVKDKGEAGVGRTFRVRLGLKPIKGEKEQRNR